MPLSMASSRDGRPICRVEGAYLHSPYFPEREAERFIAEKLGSSSPSIVVLLGSCLDYAVEPIRRRLPGSLILSLQYSSFFRGREVASADASWYPDSPQSLDAFLDLAIGEEAASGVAVIDWPPAARVFPEAAAASRSALLAVLDRLISSAATVRATGKAWLRNSCRSFLLAERALAFPRVDAPIVIAAAGPSLERALPPLLELRGEFFLIAVSSALAACEEGGLHPDLVLATDGGFWSRQHLYPLARRELPLALPLCALPSAALWRGRSLHLIDQGSFAEAELLPFLGGGLGLPPHGTVTGSALMLASALGSGPVVAAGLDLAALGDIEHARPHGFDSILASGSSRTRPLEAAAWERRSANEPLRLSGGWNGSRSLAVYAQALARDAARARGRFHRLFPSSQELPGFASLDEKGLEALFGAAGSCKAPPCSPRGGSEGAGRSGTPPSRREREAFLAERFGSWRRRAALACSALEKGEALPDPRIPELLRSLDTPDWAAARRALSRSADPGPACRALAARAVEELEDIERRLLA